ncbi:MAG TPA: hypothetical protein VFC26_01385 [Verrucomicrobiae bacterium]|nr:hypothetical protein [Verrucomicrobiae bacterium]
MKSARRRNAFMAAERNRVAQLKRSQGRAVLGFNSLIEHGVELLKAEETMPLQTRAQAKSRQDVIAEVLKDFAANSPQQRTIVNNDFDIHPGFIPPTDNWLNTLRSTQMRGGQEVLSITVKTVIEDDYTSDVADRFKVLLVSQDVHGQNTTWQCGTVTEKA